MALVSDSFHKKKLDKFGINIKTKYIVGNKILERNTDGSDNFDVRGGIICAKEYYINKELVHIENEFDSRICYTFVTKDNEEKEFSCPNCGVSGKISDFLDGCPYCGTHYNIEYTEKDLGSKYYYDQVLRSNTYRVICAVVSLVVSMVLSYFFIKFTSRTFNNYDVYKILIYGVILALVLYYVFYVVDAYIVLGPIKRYKERQNKKQQEFWERTKIDKRKFFNNLHYGMDSYYYNKGNVVDYDILDYISFNDFTRGDNTYVVVVIDFRVVEFVQGKIKSRYLKKKFVFRKNDKNIISLKPSENIIKCSKCGASVDALKGQCDYCHTEIGSIQEWVLEE